MATVVEQLTALFAAFNDRDWDAFDQVVDGFAEDFTLTLPRSGRDPVTRSAYGALVRTQVADHDDLRYDLGTFLTAESGDVALTLERHFTRRGRPFVLPLCIVARTAGTTIESITEYAGQPTG